MFSYVRNSCHRNHDRDTLVRLALSRGARRCVAGVRKMPGLLRDVDADAAPRIMGVVCHESFPSHACRKMRAWSAQATVRDEENG
jgi:hypothetical protein